MSKSNQLINKEDVYLVYNLTKEDFRVCDTKAMLGRLLGVSRAQANRFLNTGKTHHKRSDLTVKIISHWKTTQNKGLK